MSIDRTTLMQEIHGVFVTRGYDGATLAHLSDATGLSKASLYHHFPGGKPEMAQTLAREAIGALHQSAFGHLRSDVTPSDAIRQLIKGFYRYVEEHGGNCLLAVLMFNQPASRDIDELKQDISSQWQSWLKDLATVYEAMELKPKRARRQAQALMAKMYGSLLMAQLTQDDTLRLSAAKRLAKELDKEIRMNEVKHA